MSSVFRDLLFYRELEWYGTAVIPIVETASGAINGANVNFTTSVPYVRGSTVVFLNGFSLARNGSNGWIEVQPNVIRMKEAPLAGDVIQVYFLPR